jgi:hypothetical protein
MRKGLVAIMAALAAIKIFYILRYFHLLSWDEAVFVSMGKYVGSGGTQGLWEVIRPPALPFLLALPNLIKFDPVIFGDLLILAMTAGCIIYTYLLAKDLSDSNTAVIAAALTAVTPFFFLNSMMIMTDLPAAFLCVAATYHAMKKQYLMSGIASALAVMFRYPAGLIAIALVLSIALLEKKQKKAIQSLIRYIVPVVAGIGALIIWNTLVNGSPLEPFFLASDHQSRLTEGGIGLEGLLFYPKTLLFACPALLFAIFLPLKKRMMNVLLPLGIILLYLIIIPNKQERFAISFLPFLAILAAFGLTRIMKKHKVILAITIVISLSIPIYQDGLLFRQRFLSAKPDFVTDYFQFFQREGINGTVLTADPVPAAYATNRFVQYYNTIEDALIIYPQEHKTAQAIIYDSQSFPCYNLACQTRKDQLESMIKQDGTLVYNRTWWGYTKQIYILNPINP